MFYQFVSLIPVASLDFSLSIGSMVAHRQTNNVPSPTWEKRKNNVFPEIMWSIFGVP